MLRQISLPCNDLGLNECRPLTAWRCPLATLEGSREDNISRQEETSPETNMDLKFGDLTILRNNALIPIEESRYFRPQFNTPGQDATALFASAGLQ